MRSNANIGFSFGTRTNVGSLATGKIFILILFIVTTITISEHMSFY